MIERAKGLLKGLLADQEGSYMVEMALVLIGVALTVYGAASELSDSAIVPKYGEITRRIENVEVPGLTP